jgi:hypothetical protein
VSAVPKEETIESMEARLFFAALEVCVQSWLRMVTSLASFMR